MKTNIFKNAVALIATFFLFAVGSAMAGNNFGGTCEYPDIDSIDVYLTDPDCFDNPDDDPFVRVYFCFECPTDPKDLDMTVKIWQVRFSEPGMPNIPPDCDWMTAVQEAVTDYNFLVNLCPEFASLPPCSTNDKAQLFYLEPLCKKLHRNDNGMLSIIPCDDTYVECFCLTTYEYCYDNGIITKTFVSKVPVSFGNVVCPDDDDPVPVTCDIYTIDDVTVGPNPGDESECFSDCD